MTAIALLSAVAAMIIVALSGRRAAVVSPILTAAWLTSLALWSVFPLCFRFLAVPTSPSLDGGAWEQLALAQSLLSLSLAVIFLVSRRPIVPLVPAWARRVYLPVGWTTSFALGALFLTLAVEVGIIRATGASFGASTQFVVVAASGELARVGLLESLLAVLVAFGIALLTLGREAGGRRAVRALGWALVLAHAAFSVLRGMRAAILLPALVLLISVMSGAGPRRFRLSIVAAAVALTVLVGGPIAGAIGLVRGLGNTALTADVVKQSYQHGMSWRSGRERANLVLIEANRKLDSFQPGIELLRIEPTGTGGFLPIVSAVLSPIPRAVYPSKPVPTSRDGTYLGTPYRIAARAYGDPELGMVVPVTPVAIALWEHGAAGLLLLWVANLIHLLLVNSFLLAPSPIMRALSISVLSLPTAEFFLAPTASIIRDDLRLLFLAGVVVVLLVTMRKAAMAPRVHAAPEPGMIA